MKWNTCIDSKIMHIDSKMVKNDEDDKIIQNRFDKESRTTVSDMSIPN